MKNLKEDSFWNDHSKNVKKKFKKGDKVKTRKGDIETVIRVNSNGNIETEESDYSWPPDSLTLINESKTEQRLRFKIRSLVKEVLNETPNQQKQVNTSYQKLVKLCEDETDTLDPTTQVIVYENLINFLTRKVKSIRN